MLLAWFWNKTAPHLNAIGLHLKFIYAREESQTSDLNQATRHFERIYFARRFILIFIYDIYLLYTVIYLSSAGPNLPLMLSILYPKTYIYIYIYIWTCLFCICHKKSPLPPPPFSPPKKHVYFVFVIKLHKNIQKRKGGKGENRQRKKRAKRESRKEKGENGSSR